MILEPGLEHFVDISAYTATTDKSAEALDVKYREGSARQVYIFEPSLISGSVTQGKRVT